MRVVFMGTPEFAVPSLMALHDAGHTIIGVFTQPDRPSGRGNRLTPPPAKIAAEGIGAPVYQFERVRRKEGVQAMRELAPDIVVTAAYGQILPKSILDIPPRGVVNVHASLLPKYRGAAPINRCIAAGETVTGITTMYTDVGVDTGDMILAREIPIGPEEDAGELSERLAQLGAEVIVETLKAIEEGTAPRIPQDEALASHQPMLSREDGRIDWNMPAKRVNDHIRGMTPWPAAFTDTPAGVWKIWKAEAVEGDGRPGEILQADAKAGLTVACGEGALRIHMIQPSGKPRMRAEDYLRGLRGDAIRIGAHIGSDA